VATPINKQRNSSPKNCHGVRLPESADRVRATGSNQKRTRNHASCPSKCSSNPRPLSSSFDSDKGQREKRVDTKQQSRQGSLEKNHYYGNFVHRSYGNNHVHIALLRALRQLEEIALTLFCARSTVIEGERDSTHWANTCQGCEARGHLARLTWCRFLL
jgi:hypothetical protein